MESSLAWLSRRREMWLPNQLLHSVVMDGVFSVAGPTPVFFQLRGPTDEELADIVEAAANIVIDALRKDAYLAEEGVEVDRPDWLDKDFSDLG